jgi:phosphate-transporting ATPase
MLELLGICALHLQATDLVIPDGQCVAVMGESGSGKSVLLRSIADLDLHDGDAAVDGQRCSQMPATHWRQQVVYVPAESGWWADRVADHFPTDLDLAAQLPRLGLKPALADAPVARLSTGERQRLALLRAWRPGVKALLLDEPTSGLDATSTQAVEQWLREIMQTGTSILMVTHNPEQARRLARHRYLMCDGRLQETTA